MEPTVKNVKKTIREGPYFTYFISSTTLKNCSLFGLTLGLAHLVSMRSKSGNGFSYLFGRLEIGSPHIYTQLKLYLKLFFVICSIETDLTLHLNATIYLQNIINQLNHFWNQSGWSFCRKNLPKELRTDLKSMNLQLYYKASAAFFNPWLHARWTKKHTHTYKLSLNDVREGTVVSYI